MRYESLVCHFRSFHYLAASGLMSNRLSPISSMTIR
jgi:hypothetical protein